MAPSLPTRLIVLAPTDALGAKFLRNLKTSLDLFPSVQGSSPIGFSVRFLSPADTRGFFLMRAERKSTTPPRPPTRDSPDVCGTLRLSGYCNSVKVAPKDYPKLVF